MDDDNQATKLAKGQEEQVRYKAPALEKGLDILETLSNSPDGLTLKQIATISGRSPSQIFRMVTVLHRREYIRADENDRYVLTLKMFRLANKQPPIKRLVQATLPLLNELSERSRQSCHLAIYEQGHSVVIAQVDCPDRWSFGLKTGAVMGLTDTSSGHILLAYQDEVGRARMLRNHRKVEGELDIDPGYLFSMLDKVKSTGYSLMPSKQIQGVTNIAFPIYGHDNTVIAAINVPYIERIDAATVPSMTDVCDIQADICARISTLLGADDAAKSYKI